MSDNKDTILESLEKDEALKFFSSAPSAENILTPTEKEKEKEKPTDSFFTSDTLDFLDKPQDTPSEADDTPDNIEPTKKDQVVTFVNKLIESKKLAGFINDDGEDEKITSLKDAEELLELNMKEAERRGREEGLEETISQLPAEIKIALEYTMNGGDDLRGLFRALSSVQETKELSLDSTEGQEEIVEQYLEKKKIFKTKAEIREQIQEWKDLGKLETKAKPFKEELDAMNKADVQRRLEDQKQRDKDQKEASEQYNKNVYSALKDGDLNGLKIDKKVAQSLYAGLLTTDYESISGGGTNLLGHLLEKYQFIEPDYKLIAEATWLLMDPKGYKEKIREKQETVVADETARKIRTSQGLKGGQPPPEEEERPNKIKRTGFFSLK